jgi:hypothetical protein
MFCLAHYCALERNQPLPSTYQRLSGVLYKRPMQGTSSTSCCPWSNCKASKRSSMHALRSIAICKRIGIATPHIGVAPHGTGHTRPCPCLQEYQGTSLPVPITAWNPVLQPADFQPMRCVYNAFIGATTRCYMPRACAFAARRNVQPGAMQR